MEDEAVVAVAVAKVLVAVLKLLLFALVVYHPTAAKLRLNILRDSGAPCWYTACRLMGPVIVVVVVGRNRMRKRMILPRAVDAAAAAAVLLVGGTVLGTIHCHHILYPLRT
jgi:hypothetical protein